MFRKTVIHCHFWWDKFNLKGIGTQRGDWYPSPDIFINRVDGDGVIFIITLSILYGLMYVLGWSLKIIREPTLNPFYTLDFYIIKLVVSALTDSVCWNKKM